MRIALKIGDEESQVKGLIFLNAVTAYGRSLSGKVTSFPVDSGVNIADHFISNNQKFTVEGVISDFDISGESNIFKVGDEKPLNAQKLPTSPTISGPSGALKYLPGVVKQFYSDTAPTVTSSDRAQNTTAIIEGLLEELMRGNYYDSVTKKWRNKMTTTILYEVEGSVLKNARTDLVITDVSFNETPDSGEALYISFTLEKVRFGSLANTEITKQAAKPVQKKIAPKDDKGKVTGDTGTVQAGQAGKGKGPSPNAAQKWDIAGGAADSAAAGIRPGAE